MDGDPKIKNGSRDVTTPLSGRVCSSYAGTSYRTDLCTKFEFSTFTEYRDIKDDEKSKNLGGLEGRGHPRSSETSPFNRAHMTSYSTLIETMCLSCAIFECHGI